MPACSSSSSCCFVRETAVIFSVLFCPCNTAVIFFVLFCPCNRYQVYVPLQQHVVVLLTTTAFPCRSSCITFFTTPVVCVALCSFFLFFSLFFLCFFLFYGLACLVVFSYPLSYRSPSACPVLGVGRGSPRGPAAV